MLFIGVICFYNAKKGNETEKKNNKSKGVVSIVLALVFLCVNLFYMIPTARDFVAIPSYQSTSSKKEKCAWCGKMVNEKDMRGKWCKDCQNDAFGKDGWYNN